MVDQAEVILKSRDQLVSPSRCLHLDLIPAHCCAIWKAITLVQQPPAAAVATTTAVQRIILKSELLKEKWMILKFLHSKSADHPISISEQKSAGCMWMKAISWRCNSSSSNKICSYHHNNSLKVHPISLEWHIKAPRTKILLINQLIMKTKIFNYTHSVWLKWTNERIVHRKNVFNHQPKLQLILLLNIIFSHFYYIKIILHILINLLISNIFVSENLQHFGWFWELLL